MVAGPILMTLIPIPWFISMNTIFGIVTSFAITDIAKQARITKKNIQQGGKNDRLDAPKVGSICH